MANKVIVTPLFESKFKRYVKKFPSLEGEIKDLENDLIKNPELGTSLGANLYKIRLAKIKARVKVVVFALLHI